MIAEGTDPSDAQLCERDALSIRNNRQCAYELEFDSRVVCQQGSRERESVHTLTSSWERLNSRIKLPTP